MEFMSFTLKSRVSCNHLLLFLSLAWRVFAPPNLHPHAIPCEPVNVAPDVLAPPVFYDTDKLVVDNRSALEEPKASGDKIGCAPVVPPRDELFPEEGERHLTPEWLGGDQCVDYNVAGYDPLP